MKKIGIILSIIAMTAFLAIPSFACDNCDNDNGQARGVGGFVIHADAGNAVGDYDGERIPNGGAIGASGAIGVGHADAFGGILNGKVQGDVFATGGALTATEAGRYHPVFDGDQPDKAIGVRSRSTSEAVTGAHFNVKVDPNGTATPHWLRPAFGMAEGHIWGFGAEGTIDGSYVGSSPLRGWESCAFTGGIAAQGAIGGFEGWGVAHSGPDGHHYDSKAAAGAGAYIDMWGGSYSESYRYMDDNGDSHTEGLGTNVGAYTRVESSGGADNWARGNANSRACLTGGWVAAGGAATKTVQGGPGLGYAKATAVGVYAGAGQLGTSYHGSAEGYSNTSVMTVAGMKGSINTASSGMQVTSTVSHRSPNER